MKKIMIYLIIFLVSVSICEQRIDSATEKPPVQGSPIQPAFASVGAISFESRLDSWAKINTAATSGELDRIMAVILDDLGLTAAAVQIDNQFWCSRREYQLAQDGCDLRLTVEADYQKDSTAIFFTCINHDAGTDPGSWVPRLESAGDWDWSHYYLYSAYIGEPAPNMGQKELLQAVMDNLHARTKEQYSGERFYSQAGYSEKLAGMVNPVWVKNRKMNVQAVVREQADEKILLLIGSPLILGEY